jgi:hypothetical protein
MCANDDWKERSPDELQLDEASGIEALPRRVERYGVAKKRSLDQAEYIGGLDSQGALSRLVGTCGEYLLFRHYPTVDEVRLHAAWFCRKHLLCQLCALRRGAKSLGAYLPRFAEVVASEPRLRAFLVTLTVKNGPDLAERFKHLHGCVRVLWKRRHRCRTGSVMQAVAGGVWSFEVKRGENSGEWHPHVHMIVMAEAMPDQAELRREWHDITGDSFIVDVRSVDQADPASGFAEVFKYALKFADMTPADTYAAHTVLQGRRLVASAGCFRGVDVPEDLLDVPLDDLPFVELLYRYMGVGYGLSPLLHRAR